MKSMKKNIVFMSSLYIIYVICWAFAESFSALSSAQIIALRSVLSTHPPLFLQASHLASRSKLPNWVLLSISDAGEKANARISFAGFMPSAVVV